MGLEKNVGSQKWLVFAFDRTDNVPKTGDLANITAKIRKDFGGATALGDVSPLEIEDGYYEFDLTQPETNAKVLDILPESSTANIQVIGVPGRIFTVAPNFSDIGIETDGDVHADLKQWLGTAPLVLDSQRVQTTVAAMATGVITAAALAAAGANKLADHVIRRTYANVRASSDGDTVNFRSLMGAISKLVNLWSTTETAGKLTLKHEDDSTTFATQIITTDAAADPITVLNTE